MSYGDSLAGMLTFTKEPVSVDDIIARRKLNASSAKRKRDEADGLEDGESEDEEGSLSGDDDNEDSSESGIDEVPTEDESEDSDDPLATSDEGEADVSLGGNIDEDEDEMAEDAVSIQPESDSGSDSSEEETQAEKDRKAAYFDNDSSGPVHTSFSTMNLSRPILRALTSLSFTSPTPIQAATIPVALLGKDVVGNAVTGSGKTAAFMIPVLERLLYREKGKNAAAVRCVVLVPTRELGVQCYEVAKKLATHTDIRFALVVGMVH